MTKPSILHILVLSVFLVQSFGRCIQDSYGGQCVAYARAYFGGDKTKMPPLSNVSRDLGAYNAYGYWNLGYGYGNIPESQSIFVQARSRYSPLGHMGVVTESIRRQDGKYLLIVNDSNWGNDERVDCGRKLVYDPVTREAVRDQGSPRIILGFIYSRNMNQPTGTSFQDLFGGLERPNLTYRPQSIPNQKSRFFFNGFDQSSLGLERVPILYRSAKGYAMNTVTQAKVLGLQTYNHMKDRGRDGLELVILKTRETSNQVGSRASSFARQTYEQVRRKWNNRNNR